MLLLELLLLILSLIFSFALSRKIAPVPLPGHAVNPCLFNIMFVFYSFAKFLLAREWQSIHGQRLDVPVVNGVGYAVYGETKKYIQAFSQKGVQVSWDAHRTKNGRLWTPKFPGEKGNYIQLFP